MHIEAVLLDKDGNEIDSWDPIELSHPTDHGTHWEVRGWSGYIYEIPKVPGQSLRFQVCQKIFDPITFYAEELS